MCNYFMFIIISNQYWNADTWLGLLFVCFLLNKKILRTKNLVKPIVKLFLTTFNKFN